MASELYDSITGVYTRSLLNTRLQHEVGRAVRSNLPLSLLMLDVDYFKSINDAFGHSRGDQALAEIASRIQAQVRQSDEIFRFGGDEFVILLPQINKQQADILAQRILNHISESPLTGNPSLVLSVSIGVSSYPEDGVTPQSLFEVADNRHYQSKIMGRARVVSQDIENPRDRNAADFDRLIERDRALSQLRQFTDALATTVRGVLHITGKKGVGYSRFLQEVRNIFRLRGYASFWLGGRSVLQSRVYGAIDEAFQTWENPPQAITAESTETYLADFIERKNLNGLVLLLDDWQYLDDASIGIINHLYNSNQLKHIALIYAGEDHITMPMIDSGKDEPFKIELFPLSEMGVRVWLRKSIGQELPEELIRLITSLSGGLPARLASVLQWLVSEEKQNLENQNFATVIAHLQSEHEHILYDTAVRPNNLPESLPVFLGRESEILQIKKLLQEKYLVTLLGTGGVGKTRLALQVAGEVLDQFKDGVFFIALDSIAAPEFAFNAIAQALEFKLDPRREPLEQFLLQLSPKQVLLVLDNFETVLDETNLLKQIMDRAPAAKLLVTTRERLNIPGEIILGLNGLSFPNLDSADLEVYPAVRLFLQYARLQPDFEPDLESISRICRLVDGIPLGIELASAWVSTLSCEQIAQRIEQNLSFLAVDNDLGYHRSLIAIFDSVWVLFSKSEIRVLMGLGIFKGGFSRQAAAKITGASHFFLDAVANKLLIQRSGPHRYALHMSFSQYLLEKLRADPLLASHIEAQHNLFYLGYLRDCELALQKSVSPSLLNDILSDIDNIRTAWNQMAAAGNYRALEPTLSAWMVLLRNRGWFREAIDCLETLNSKLTESSDGFVDAELFYLRIKSYLGDFYYHVGNYHAGIQELESVLDHLTGDKYPDEEAEIFRLLGNNLSAIGRSADSKAMYQRGLSLAEKMRNPVLAYQFINSLGVGAYLEADYQGAIPIAEHALEIARQLDHKGKIAQSLNNLGNLYYEIGDYTRARKLLAETLSYLPDIDGQTLKGSIFDTMGKILTASEEYPYACQIFLQGLDLVKDIEATPLTIELLVSVSELLNGMKEKSLAITLARLLADYPAAPTEIRARAVDLYNGLSAENIQPEDHNWRVDQIRRVVVDVMQILGQKSPAH